MVHRIFLVLLLPLIMAFSSPQTQEVRLKFTNLENNEGVIRISVYDSQENFKGNKPIKIFKVKKNTMKNGQLSAKVYLPKGRIGVVVFDDENEDGEFNNNLVGYPTEGYGFSFFEHKGFSRPVFSDFDFVVENKVISVPIKMRYL